jgi:predicted phage gp36 major capsid-like protein
MNEAIAYYTITASSEFREMERLWEKARHDEAQALENAEKRGEERSDKKWQSIVAEIEAENEILRKLHT